MNVYTLTGLLILLLADYVQIAEEWTARGLTDTSYKVCCLLISGPLCIAYGFFQSQDFVLVYVFLGLSLCGTLMLGMKLRDLVRTRLKMLS
jgi:NADH:ubiquinone oxidoreductase subunit 4 (subunit M)